MVARWHRGPMLPRLALATTIVLWASAFPAIRAALEGYSAAHLSVLRLLAAALALGAVAAARGVRLPARRDVPAMAGLGLTGMTAYQVLLNSGERTVPAGRGSLIVNVSPVIVALVATTLLGERLTRAGWAGIAIAFGGVTIIALTGEGGVQLSAGALLVLGAAVVQAAYFVGSKPLLARYDALELTAWAMALGALFTLPLSPGLPVAILVGWAWLGELPRISSLAGGAVALAGVALVTRRGRLAADAEAADHQERALADGAGAGQDAELDGRAPQVEEGAHVEQPVVAQLAVEDDVDDEEAVRGAVAADRVAVGAEQLRRRGDVAPVGQPLPGALQPCVGEGAPQPLRM